MHSRIRAQQTPMRTMKKLDVKILDPRIRAQLAALRHARARRARPARLHRCAARSQPGADRADPDRHRDPSRRPGSRRGDHAALGTRPQARHRARQPRRADRLRLPGPADGVVLEPRPEARSGRAAASASRSWSSCPSCRWSSTSSRLRGERARRGRLRQDRQGLKHPLE